MRDKGSEDVHTFFTDYYNKDWKDFREKYEIEPGYEDNIDVYESLDDEKKAKRFDNKSHLFAFIYFN